MSFSEDIIRLRQKVAEAVKRGLVSSDKDIFEASLIQIMNDSEKNRVTCATQAENFRKQASIFDGQASAFASMSGIIYNVLNGYITINEREEAERLALEAELAAEKEERQEALTIETVSKKRKTKIKAK